MFDERLGGQDFQLSKELAKGTPLGQGFIHQTQEIRVSAGNQCRTCGYGEIDVVRIIRIERVLVNMGDCGGVFDKGGKRENESIHSFRGHQQAGRKFARQLTDFL
jgi:hypothetical protein